MQIILSKNIKKERNKLKISQEKLAALLGCNRGNIASYEEGRANPDLSVLLRMAKIFSISLEELIIGQCGVKKEDNIGKLSHDGTGYPLVEQCAIAGFGNADFMIKEEDVKAYYVVPKFQNNRIDFMIEIRGSSMYPKYNSGDVIACTIIKESRFIQWNKVHVIATREQGLLVKRLKPGATDDTYTVISDNKEYPPFEIPKSEVSDIALVVGVIRLE